MKGEQVVAVARGYADLIENDEIYLDDGSSHLVAMATEIKMFVDEGRIEKAMRWLGFMQGALWAGDWFTIEQLAEHNRTGDVTYEP